MDLKLKNDSLGMKECLIKMSKSKKVINLLDKLYVHEVV